MNNLGDSANNTSFNRGRIDVPDEFKHVFSHFYCFDNQSSMDIKKTLLPSFQNLCVFNFKQKIQFIQNNQKEYTIEKYLLLGPIKQAIDYVLPPNSEILVVTFKDDAFYRFFGDLSDKKSSDSLITDDFLKECFSAMWQGIEKLNSITERIDSILEFCRPYLSVRHQVVEPLLNARNMALDPIKSVAELSNQSVRHMQVHYKKYFGYTAKERRRYQRFLKAMTYIDSRHSIAKPVDWSSIAFDCGYYDQSHFIRDFKHFLNLTPSQYLQSREYVCNSAQ